MAWPTTPASTTTTDNDADKISASRADINQTISNVNDIIGSFNIPASPTDNYILVYDSATGKFEVEALPASGGDVVDDTTPQLGGTLDANGNSITDSTRSFVRFDKAVQIADNLVLDSDAGIVTRNIEVNVDVATAQIGVAVDFSASDKAIQVNATADSTKTAFELNGNSATDDTTAFAFNNVNLDTGSKTLDGYIKVFVDGNTKYIPYYS